MSLLQSRRVRHLQAVGHFTFSSHRFISTHSFFLSYTLRDRVKKIGSLQCRVCNAEYQALINYLSEPIDVFSEWLDECERVADVDDA